MSKASALSFTPVYRKIARARKHVIAIDSEMKEAIQAVPLRVGILDDGITVRLTSPLSADAADDIATLVGDVLHNLRSCLDITAVESVRLSGKSPKDVYFPFANSKEQLVEMIKKRHFDRANDECMELITELKPFSGEAGNRMLRALHDLNIVDKHRTLMLLKQVVFIPTIFFENGAVISHSSFSVPAGQDPIMDIAIGRPQYVRWDQSGLPEELHVPLVELEFASGHPFEGRSVIPVLQELCDMTQAIVDQFVAIFRRTA